MIAANCYCEHLRLDVGNDTAALTGGGWLFHILGETYLKQPRAAASDIIGFLIMLQAYCVGT